jgi:hypothetical protein
MSDFNALGLMFALGVANASLYFFQDRWIHNGADAVATGVVRGVPVSTTHRWLLLYTSWLSAVAAAVAIQVVIATGWTMMGRSLNGGDPQLFAYLASFITWAAVAGWIVLSPFWYARLAAVLRQAEAD